MTGVQTCALPIFGDLRVFLASDPLPGGENGSRCSPVMEPPAGAHSPAETPAAPSDAPVDASSDHPHDFTVQREVHRQIRNDPDYDDWEYGTEPLPQESWSKNPGAPTEQA